MALSASGVTSLPQRLRLLAIAAAVLLTVTVLAVAIWLTRQLDDDARAKTEWMVASSVRAMVASSEAIAHDYGLWTAAHEAAHANDLDWLDENMVSDTMDLLTIGDGPLAAPRSWTADGVAHDPGRSAAFLEAGAALLVAAADMPHDAPASGFARIDGAAWLLTAQRVIPHTRPLAPGEETAVIVAANMLTPEIAAATGEALALDGLRFTVRPDPALDHVALVGPDGPVAYLAWPAPQPGAAALRAVLPPLALALLVGVAALMLGALAIGRLARRLERALVASEAADRTKAEFIASLSHELRTPMNGIIGMLELLQTTSLTAEQSEFVEIAIGSAETQVEMIEQLLAFGQIDAGHMHLSLAPFVPEELAREVVALAARAAQDKGLRLDLRLGGETGLPLLGDRLAIRQILVNLVGNAVKFTETGGVTVALAVRGGLDGRRLQLAVADTGPGIAPAERERIFESFVQGDGSPTRKAGGVGLGLSISRRLAALMGGTLSLESVPDAGSTFRFEVTLDSPVAAPAALGSAA